MWFNILIPYINTIVIAFVVLLGLYIKTYTSETAKNKALNFNIKKITEEKEQIISRFQKELEDVKKEHELDIAKRKYLYESKSQAYNKFLTFLDNYNTKMNVEWTNNFMPVLEKFNKDFLKAANKLHQSKIITNFTNTAIQLTKDAYEDYNKLKSETNIIRLSSSSLVLDRLNKFEDSTKNSLEEAEIMLKRLPLIIRDNDQQFIEEYKTYMETLAKGLEISRKLLIEYMRIDLENI